MSLNTVSRIAACIARIHLLTANRYGDKPMPNNTNDAIAENWVRKNCKFVQTPLHAAAWLEANCRLATPAMPPSMDDVIVLDEDADDSQDYAFPQ